MDCRSMIDREPFFETLFKTIVNYYQEVHGNKISISREKRNDAKIWYLYTIPTFLAEKKLSYEMRQFLYSEYNIRGNLLKYLIGKIGVFVITHSCGLLAKDKFYIKSKNDNPPMNVFISPCNRSIRFYNFEQGYVDCIVKDGYSNFFMMNQLKFRQENEYEFVSKVIDSGDRWYREKIMYGHALARVRDESLYQATVSKALSCMKQIVDKSLIYISSNDYLDKLKDKITKSVKQILITNNSELVLVYDRLFTFIEKKTDGANIDIPTAITHGDFQGGNIWLSNDNKITIYDWETNGRRSVWYDPATLLWRLHSNPFSVDLENLVRQDKRFLINDPKIEYQEFDMQIIAWILLLENIQFYLDDISQLLPIYSEKRVIQLTEELKKMLIERGITNE